MIDLDFVRRTLIACKHCGNIVAYEIGGGCPMRYPQPDCWTSASAAREALWAARAARAMPGTKP